MENNMEELDLRVQDFIEDRLGDDYEGLAYHPVQITKDPGKQTMTATITFTLREGDESNG